MSLSLPDARRAWAAAQGLGQDGRVADIPSGWIRSLGAADPYLALRARVPGFRAADLGAALSDDRVQVVPGVRGCIWLVPSRDVPLCLRVSEASDRSSFARSVNKAGSSEAELADVGAAVLEALAAGPATTRELGAALPDGTVRSLGDAGKKVGLSTTLPPALRRLEWAGRIRRRHVDASLLHERYTWEPTDPAAVFAQGDDPGDDADAQARALAAHFLTHVGPTTLDAFRSWSKLGKRVSVKALDAAAAGTGAIDELGDAWLPGAVPEGGGGVHLLPGLDNLLTMQARPANLADAAWHDVPLPNMGRRLAPVGKVNWLQVKPVVRAGAWIGVWEWDPDGADQDGDGSGGIAWAPFGDWDAATRDAFHAERAAVEAFVHDELGGSCKSSGIDSEKRQRERAAHVRGLA